MYGWGKKDHQQSVNNNKVVNNKAKVKKSILQKKLRDPFCRKIYQGCTLVFKQNGTENCQKPYGCYAF